MIKSHPFALALAFSVVLGVFNPILGLPAAFLILFFTTGYSLLSLFKIDLAPSAKLGASIVLSVLVSTHAVNIVATAFGRFDSTVLSLVLLALALFCYLIDLDKLKRELRELSGDWRPLLAGGLAFVVVTCVLYFSLFKPVAGGFANGGWNWSDYLLHYSIMSSINAGNYPPQTPYFAGYPLVYHYFADFHTAIFAKASALSILDSTILAQGLLSFSLSLLAYAVALYFLKNPRAALIASLLFVFSGGLGFIEAAQAHLDGKDVLALVHTRSFDNDWSSKTFKIPSVLGVGLLTHRATTVGLPAFAMVLLLAIYAWSEKNRAKAFVAGLACALLAPFHFFAFPIAVVCAGGLFAYRLLEARPVKRAAFDQFASLSAYFVVPLLLAVPFAITPLAQAQVGGTLKFNLGWESQAKNAYSFIQFYLLNLGLPFALALFASVFTQVRDKRYLLLATAFLFAVPNVISFTAIPWDMNKFFQFMALPVSILAAALVNRLHAILAGLLIAISAVSPFLLCAWFVLGSPFAVSNADVDAARWIETNTVISDVFVTDIFINQPTDLAGRLRLLTFTPYVSNNGYNPGPRESDVKEIYCQGDGEKAADLMMKHGANHVIVKVFGECASTASRTFSQSSRFNLVFENSGLQIYRLRTV